MSTLGVRDEVGLTVLVVEDDPTHQLLVRKSLLKEGSTFAIVQVAGSAEDAEHYARQMEFDAVLIDNRIPGRRGLDLVATLRDQGVRAPFVLMTAAGSEDLAVKAYRSQCADYVVKDGDFWRDLPRLMCRVIASDRERKRSEELSQRLKRANEKLDALNTEIQLQNQQLLEAQRELKAHNSALAETNQALVEGAENLKRFNQLLSKQVEAQVAPLQGALSSLTTAQLKALPKKNQAQLKDAKAAAEALRALLDRLAAIGILDEVEPEALESIDPELIFERVEAALSQRAAG